MTLFAFCSSLAKEISDFVTFKQLEGFDYTGSAKSLVYFDTFCVEQKHCQALLNRQIVDDYIKHTANLAPNTRYTRLCSVRVFSRYLNLLNPKSYVLHDIPIKKSSLPRWYLYTPEDISILLRHALTLGPVGSLRPHCIHTIVGLLYVTGLRVSEALALNVGDLNLSRGLLFVRKGKFKKERYVPLHPSTVKILKEYLVKRDDFEPTIDSSPVFFTTYRTRLSYDLASKTFRKMIKTCEIAHDSPLPPRIHDLRHSYACNCLLKWYQEDADIDSKLPILSTVMGHVNIASTQIYLHISSRHLALASRRFHATFTAICKGV